MLDLLFQFVAELMRALLVDELSDHVRRKISRSRDSRSAPRRSSARLIVHRRNRDRLLNRLRTASDAET